MAHPNATSIISMAEGLLGNVLPSDTLHRVAYQSDSEALDALDKSSADSYYDQNLIIGSAMKDPFFKRVIQVVHTRGDWDAHLDTFPATGGSGPAGAIAKHDLFVVTVAGDPGSGDPIHLGAGDTIRALSAAPGQDETLWEAVASPGESYGEDVSDVAVEILQYLNFSADGFFTRIWDLTLIQIKTILGISISDSQKAAVDVKLVGGWDASGDEFPTAGNGSGVDGAIMKGDMFDVTTGGSPGGADIAAGATLLALVDAPEQTLANWRIFP